MSDPFWRSPYVEWMDDLPADHALLVGSIRTARGSAKVAAVFEILSLLKAYAPRALLSGPAAERKATYWVALPQAYLDAARVLLPRLGYTSAVDLAQPANGGGLLRWRGTKYRLTPLYREDADMLREQAPDRREFLLRSPQGELVAVKGYRGDGKTFGKRGLPVYDARLLVNLVCAGAGDLLLDPFGGIGGVILAAHEAGARAVSADNDPVVAPGLAALADLHALADARQLPFADESFTAAATEPPYDGGDANPLPKSVGELTRLLKRGGRLAVLCAGWQAAALRERAARAGLVPLLESPVNRKGLEVFVFLWQKPA